MFEKGSNPNIPCLTDWRDALNRPGATDMKYVKRIFEARPFSELVPDQSLISGKNPNDSLHIQAAVSGNGSFALIYLSVGQKVSVDLSKLKNKLVAYWYNPREGTAVKIRKYKNSGIQIFDPPTQGSDNDWLLVLDAINCNLKPITITP